MGDTPRPGLTRRMYVYLAVEAVVVVAVLVYVWMEYLA